MRKQPVLPLLPILGKMPFWGFFSVTLLVVSLLATINFVSKHVINSYVNDQVRQIQWDQVVYQFYDLPAHEIIRRKIAALPHVERVETLAWLRLGLTSQTLTELSGRKGVYVPWVTLVSASDLTVLPPALRQERTLGVIGSQQNLQSMAGHLARAGTIQIHYRPGEDDGDTRAVELLSRSFDRVIQVDRRDIIQWVMREVGSTTFVGHEGLILVVPFKDFSNEVVRLTTALKSIDDAGSDEEDESAQLTFTPELDHLVKVDRAHLVGGWDLDESKINLARVVEQVHRVAQAHSFRSVTNSDLYLTVNKLAANRKFVTLVSVLLSSPILVMLWVFAANLASLVVLNSKRTMGLLRLRGVSGYVLRQATVIAIGVGGLIGGILGGVIGSVIPGLAYQFAGDDIAWRKLDRIQEPWFLIGFIVIGTLFAMVSGRKVTQYCTRVSPHEATARVSASEAEEFAFRWGWFQTFALVLGGYKVFAWVLNFAPSPGPLLRLDRILDFIGAPLFIYGVTALIVAQPGLLRTLFIAFSAPIAGAFRWFVGTNMMMRRHRTSSAILIAALMFAITLYPQVTADSFYEKLVRGVRLNTGADLAVILDSTELLGHEVKTEAISAQMAALSRKAEPIADEIRKVAGVNAASVLYELQIPGDFYLPGGMTNLPLYMVNNAGTYLSTAYSEESLGIGQKFAGSMSGTASGIVVSKGLAAFEGVGVGRAMVVGHGADGEVEDQVSGVVALLPGAPQVMLQTREAYVGAEIEYLNLLGRTSPFIVATADRQIILPVKTTASRTVVLVDAADGAAPGEVSRRIGETLSGRGIRPLEIKSVGDEEHRLGKDMFVSLGLENIRIYLIGGIAVALAGILAVSLANFSQMRWTLGLLRIRGGAPKHLVRIIVAEFFVPIVFGMVIGITMGIVTGYGMTNQMFKVPQTLAALEILPVHLTLTGGAFIVAPLLGLFFLGTAIAFSVLVFRRTAREGLRE